jgi:predicted tellurium resistance membrane protein TerC
MAMFFDRDLIYLVGTIIFLEGILSIGNVAIIGAMVVALPNEGAIPGLSGLRCLGQPFQNLLGGPRSAALKLGLLGSISFRAAMLLLADFVVQNRWLQLLAVFYLIKLGMERLGRLATERESAAIPEALPPKGFWRVLLATQLAGLSFAINDVMEVATLSAERWLDMFGIVVGIVTMCLVARGFTAMAAREPALRPAAYLVAFTMGAELLPDELLYIRGDPLTKFMVSGGTMMLTILYTRIPLLQELRPALYWAGRGMAIVNRQIDWAMRPFAALARLSLRMFLAVLRLVATLAQRR